MRICEVLANSNFEAALVKIWICKESKLTALEKNAVKHLQQMWKSWNLRPLDAAMDFEDKIFKKSCTVSKIVKIN